MKPIMQIPENWTLDANEIASGHLKVKATATDGRTIEASGADDERLIASVIASIHEFEERRKMGR